MRGKCHDKFPHITNISGKEKLWTEYKIVDYKSGKGVKLSLYLIYNQALCHEIIWWSGGIDPPFLTSAHDEGK